MKLATNGGAANVIVELSVEDIRRLANALVTQTYATDTSSCDPRIDYVAETRADRELCARLEAFLPDGEPRSDFYWMNR